ncbi:CrcB family protein [Jiangella anatolica]|uniref:CrcB family protein n=1 Tax=Jiangella anatolica TaxID=2670374 RepID=UPI0011B7CBA4|nr:CrcB family protein [Jiangella anatolica]
MTSLAMMAGAALGVLVRLLLDRPRRPEADTDRHQRRSLTVGLAGALLLGGLTGAAMIRPSAEASMTPLAAGLTGALTTYCLFTSALVARFVRVHSRVGPGTAVLEVVASLAAATCGVLAGLALARLA